MGKCWWIDNCPLYYYLDKTGECEQAFCGDYYYTAENGHECHRETCSDKEYLSRDGKCKKNFCIPGITEPDYDEKKCLFKCPANQLRD